MTKIVVDEALLKKLGYLAQPVELVDASGRALGRVLPVVDLSEYELCEPPISEEELQRREQSDEWYTTEQVLAQLKNLEN